MVLRKALVALIVVAASMGGRALAQDNTALGPAQEPLYKAALEAAESGEHDKALEILKGLVLLGELDIAHMEMARNLIELGRCDEAEASIASARQAPRAALLSDEEATARLEELQNNIALNCAGKANAAQLYELGLDYFKNRDWLKAAQAFELALASDENATLAHNAGRSYEYAGDLEKAEVLYKKALALTDDAALRDRFERNLERLENLRSMMGSTDNDQAGLLDITSEPAGAIVRIDGAAVGETPYQQAAVPGSVEVTLELDGFAPHKQTIVLEPGREVVLSVALEPEGRVWTWISLGTTVALASGGLTFGLLAENDLEELQSVDGRRREDFDSLQERGQLFSNLSLSFYIAAAATTVVTGLFFVYETPERELVPTEEAPTSLRLLIAPDFIGIGGHF